MIMIKKQQEYIETQKKIEDQQRREKERFENERIEQIKHKNKDEESKNKVYMYTSVYHFK